MRHELTVRQDFPATMFGTAVHVRIQFARGHARGRAMALHAAVGDAAIVASLLDLKELADAVAVGTTQPC